MRALSAVAFLASAALVATSPKAAIAHHAPRIVVDPVVSYANGGVTQIRVSIVNESSAPIVVDPDEVDVLARPVARGGRGRHARFFSMVRLPCRPSYTAASAYEYVPVADKTLSNANGTTIVWSTPEPPPSTPSTPREPPIVLAAGATVLGAPAVFSIGCSGGRVGAQIDVYAVVTWHYPNSSKRSRIRSNVVRVDPPPIR